jgi:hypothetical protein
MRLVEEGFGESIPAVVIRVYSVALTVPGEVSLRKTTHLEQLPKTLTSSVLRQVRAVLTDRGLRKSALFRAAHERRTFDPESPHLKKISRMLGEAASAGETP